MGASSYKEFHEAVDKLIADHKKRKAERLQRLLERCERYESLDDILKKRCGLTQEQIDHYQFRVNRELIDAETQRFLNEEY
jgi:hypothetical protein